MAKLNQDGPDHIDVYVGARVRDRRRELNLSQQDLADIIGRDQDGSLSFQQVQKYERGANRISASRLWRIAKALQVSVAYFFDGVPDTAPEAMGDPVMTRARAIYEAARKRVKHRPPWDDLDVNDPFDKALAHTAIDAARAEVA
jgi:transcriptional regulator with XRE-family HTH domain